METIGPVTLQNDVVRLEPLSRDHAADLAALTVGTGITRWFPQPLESRGDVDRFIAEALEQESQGLALPFTIFDAQGWIVGSTRFGAVVAQHRRVEIGWTFVGAPWQRTAINTAAKLLLLTHAFEGLGCIRVEFKTDSRNQRSRNAIGRLGATEEGILRRHMICADGYIRDTVYFSIVAEEWPDMKARLQTRLA